MDTYMLSAQPLENVIPRIVQVWDLRDWFYGRGHVDRFFTLRLPGTSLLTESILAPPPDLVPPRDNAPPPWTASITFPFLVLLSDGRRAVADRGSLDSWLDRQGDTL